MKNDVKRECEEFKSKDVLYELKHDFLNCEKRHILILSPNYKQTPKTIFQWQITSDQQGIYIF